MPDAYKVFATESEAIAAEAQISASMGFSGSITSRWSVPVQLADGRWAIPSPDGTGVPVGRPGLQFLQHTE